MGRVGGRVLATVWGVGWCQGQSLTVDLAGVPIQLEANLAGQKVVIMGSSSGSPRWACTPYAVSLRVGARGLQHGQAIRRCEGPTCCTTRRGLMRRRGRARRGLLEMGIESNDGVGQGHASLSKASRKTMVRLKEIAEAAGVSVMTVSKALRDRRDVAVATKARIRALSESMGYVPNLSAMGLRSRTTRMFGLIIPATTDPVYARVQLAIEQNAADQGYDLLFAQSLGMADREEAALRRFLARGVDGIFLSPVQCMPRPTPYLDEVRRRGIPLVVLGHRTPCCEGFANVETDDLAASASATRHLLELGHRRIAFLAGPQASPSAQERLQGYRRALREAGIEGDDRWVFNAGSTIEEGTHAALQWMQEKTDVTAIQAVNDLVAIGAAEALLNQGFRIPQDVSVVGYGNILAAEHFRAPLTTVRQPKLRLGAVAMDLMLSWLKDGKPASRRIPAELIVRASTGKASAG